LNIGGHFIGLPPLVQERRTIPDFLELLDEIFMTVHQAACRQFS
jgi:hypothetical protein